MLDYEYVRRFVGYAQIAMERRAKDGKVVIDFHRLYYLGKKP